MDSGKGISKASSHGRRTIIVFTYYRRRQGQQAHLLMQQQLTWVDDQHYLHLLIPHLLNWKQLKNEEVSKLTKDKIQLKEYTKQTLQVFQQKYLATTTKFVKEKTEQIQLLEMELASKKPLKNCLLPATAALAAASAPSNATASDAGVSQKPPPPLLGGPASSTSSSTISQQGQQVHLLMQQHLRLVFMHKSHHLLNWVDQLSSPTTTAAASAPPSSAPQQMSPQPIDVDCATIEACLW